MSDLETRLVRVEQSLRRWRWVATGAAAIAIASVAVQARAASRHEIRLTDGDGTMVLATNSLTFRGPGGPEASLSVSSQGGMLALHGKDGADIHAQTLGANGDIGVVSGLHRVSLDVGSAHAESVVTSGEEGFAAHASNDVSMVIGSLNEGGHGHILVNSGGAHDPATIALGSANEKRMSVVLEGGHGAADIRLHDDKGERTLRSTP